MLLRWVGQLRNSASTTRSRAHNPPILIAPAALVLAIAVLNAPLMRSDFEHRSGALVDALTGLANRKSALRAAEALELQSVARGFEVGLIVGDLDGFKSVNDELGHREGDALLAETARVLGRLARATDTVARLGGDEFLILSPGGGVAEMHELAERLRRELSEHSGRAREYGVTISFGVAASERGEPFDYGAAFEAADRALREAKQGLHEAGVTVAPAEGPKALDSGRARALEARRIRGAEGRYDQAAHEVA